MSTNDLPHGPDEAALLAAVRNDPNDETARLVYADWLADRGDPRAELLRMSVAERRGEAAIGPGTRGYLLRLLHPAPWVSAVAGPVPTRAAEYPLLPYQWVGRDRPGCVVLLVSRAGWLRSAQPGGRAVGDQVADAVNRCLSRLVDLAYWSGQTDQPMHRFDIGVIGYGTNAAGAPEVGSLLSGPLSGRDLVPVNELADHPLEIERRRKKEFVDDGAGGEREVEKEIAFPVWYRPGGRLMSGSPMNAGLNYVCRVTARWALDHPANFPPFVLHLSDGACGDGDPAGAFDRLGAVATDVGPLFLANVLMGDAFGEPARFPTVSPTGPAACRLYRGATPLSTQFLKALFEPECRSARALLVNTDPQFLFNLLPTGSDPRLYSSAVQAVRLPPHLQ